jgi:O-acetyl-ADP-ribose deacetylase (regulator of RNase III)
VRQHTLRASSSVSYSIEHGGKYSAAGPLARLPRFLRYRYIMEHGGTHGARSVRERLAVEKGNIVIYRVDALVNAANPSLLGGGGVDGAIHRAAGPELQAACRPLGGCAPGDAKITPGFRLPARHVIHTVGPIWKGGTQAEAETLACCYRRSLALAHEHGAHTIAFPAISCGAYGYPVEEAAGIAVREASAGLKRYGTLEKVYLVCFSDEVFKAYRRAYEALV